VPPSHQILATPLPDLVN